MENKVIQTLSNDEVVIFIANRHGIDAQSLVKNFLTGQGKTSALLENEVAIIQGLLNQYQKEKV